MKPQRKKLEFVIIEHSLLKPFTFKEAIVWKVIWIKARNRKLNEFPYTQNHIPMMTGIAKNTVTKALDKFKELELINILDNHKIHLSSNNFEDVFKGLDNDYICEEEKNRNGDILVPYIHFNFELCKKLKLNPVQYSILHTFYILAKKRNYAFISPSYFVRNFRIEIRDFYYIKSKLTDLGYIFKRGNSNLVYISDEVIDMFKNCTIEKIG